MTPRSSGDGSPEFEDPFGEDDTEQQIFATVLQLREPTAPTTVADRVGCDPKTARKYLRWFTQLGVVTAHNGHPTTYERNDAYFEWRRVNDLAAEHSQEALQDRVQALTARITDYEDEYGASSPAAVDAVAAAEDGDHGTIDEVYGDLGEWATARAERRRYERARRHRANAADHESAQP